MNSPESQENGDHALLGQGPSMLQHQNPRREQSQQAAASQRMKTSENTRISAEEQMQYQIQLAQLEQQNKKRLQMAKAEQNENSRNPSLATPAPHINGNHALQDYQIQLQLLDRISKKRFESVRAETTETSGGPSVATPAPHGNSPHALQEASGGRSNETPTRHDTDNNHAGAQKRKRGNSDEGRLIQIGGAPSCIIAGEPNFRNMTDLVRNRDQEVCVSPGCTLLTGRNLIIAISSYHLTLILFTRSNVIRVTQTATLYQPFETHLFLTHRGPARYKVAHQSTLT
jgi:hypothetical protein